MGQRGRGDVEWGRVPGAAPPLPAGAPLLAWLVLAAVLTATVVGVVGGPGPLDDPDQGDQRPGLLVDVDEVRLVRGLELPGDPIGRRPVFIAFDRAVPPRAEFSGVLDEVPDRYAAVLVVPGWVPRAPSVPGGEVIGDPERWIADAVGMSRPKDGGPPIGYAVVDSRARVRYATIDPTWTMHGFEVERVTEPIR